MENEEINPTVLAPRDPRTVITFLCRHAKTALAFPRLSGYRAPREGRENCWPNASAATICGVWGLFFSFCPINGWLAPTVSPPEQGLAGTATPCRDL